MAIHKRFWVTVGMSLGAITLLSTEVSSVWGRETLNLLAQSQSIQSELEEANRLNRQVQELFDQRRFQEATPLAERVLEIQIRALGEDHLDTAISIDNLAKLYENQGHYDKAEPLYCQALEIRKRIIGTENPLIAISLNNLATLYEKQGHYDKAKPFYRQALEISKRFLGAHRLTSLYLNNLAGLYQRQGHYGDAEKLYLQAIDIGWRLLGRKQLNLEEDNFDIFSLLNDLEGMLVTFNNLALLYQRQARYSDAEKLHLKALDFYKLLWGEEHPKTLISLNYLALLYNIQGRYSQAEKLYLQVLNIHIRLFGEEHPHTLITRSNLAVLYDNQGQYAKAEILYLQIADIQKRLLGEEHPETLVMLSNLAGLYAKQGQYIKAEALYLQIADIQKRLLGEEHPETLTVLNNLAVIYDSQGRFSEAESLHLQVLEIRKRVLGEEHSDTISSINNLATVYQGQKRYDKVENLYSQTLEVQKHLLGEKHPTTLNTFHNLATLYDSQGKYNEAEYYYTQAWQIMKEVLGKEHPNTLSTLSNLAFFYSKQGQYSKARSLYSKVIEIRKRVLGEEHPDTLTSINNLATVYVDSGDYSKAETLLIQIAEINMWVKEKPFLSSISFNNLAFLYLVQGEPLLAIEFLKQALEVEESSLDLNLGVGSDRQKRDFIKLFSDTGNFSISIHLQALPDNLDAARVALATLLQRKGRLLDLSVSNLQLLRQRENDVVTQELLDHYSDIIAQLTNLFYRDRQKIDSAIYQTEQDKLQRQYQQLEDQLSRRSETFRVEKEPLTLESVQKLIPENAALVEFVQYRPFDPKAKPQDRFGAPRYAVYILDRQGNIQAVDLGEAETIDRALKPFHEALRDRGTSITEFQESAREVDRIVMEPVRQRLGNTSTLLLSPDGNLNLIPFEALVDENGNYLVKNYAFTYLTSGRDLLRLNLATPSQNPAFVLGNPKYNRPGEVVASTPNTTRTINLSKRTFSSLDGTDEEAQTIAQRLNTQPLLEQAATEAAVKQVQRPSILHLATHAFFENPTTEFRTLSTENPLLFSGLVFAGVKLQQSGTDNDGILSALEATGLDLFGTQLVVLSACDTGVGENVTGEGIYSLRRAFVIAGSESQLISLWKVEDTASKNLMITYYDKLLKGEGRSAALRQTQLEMLKGETYNHPYYWASFIPSGNWRPLTNLR